MDFFDLPTKNLFPALLFPLLLLSLLSGLTGCSAGGAQDDAAAAVEAYYTALVAGDVNQMRLLSCASWEESAQLEFDAFGGVETELEDLDCQVGGSAGEDAVVTCSGKILAAYGNEIQEIDLSLGEYKTRLEGGEWRMCGY